MKCRPLQPCYRCLSWYIVIVILVILPVLAVHAYCLDINYADEIQKFGCHVSRFVKNYVIFLKVFLSI